MDQQRTITKLRMMKISIMFSLLLLAYAVVLGVLIEVNKESIMRNLRDKATESLGTKYDNNMSLALKTCNDAFQFFVKSQENALLLGITGLVIALIFIRLPLTQRQKSLSSLCFSFGSILLVLYYLAVGIILPSAAKLDLAKAFVSWLFYPAIALFSLGLILFIYHSFRKIVVES